MAEFYAERGGDLYAQATEPADAKLDTLHFVQRHSVGWDVPDGHARTIAGMLALDEWRPLADLYAGRIVRVASIDHAAAWCAAHYRATGGSADAVKACQHLQAWCGQCASRAAAMGITAGAGVRS